MTDHAFSAVQISLSVMVNPPKPGDESFEQYNKERTAEIASLRRRAQIVTDGFNALEGVTCNFTEGAMYSFPRVSAMIQKALKMVMMRLHLIMNCCVCLASNSSKS